ncbi:MAG: chromosomal replication initiator protein DnaA [Kiritimatiellae bacterium]|nr:chromosomal replication initiator protein DnaA [Kiritimatiellia bacterium]
MKQATAQVIWKKACKHLESVLHPDVYERWIAVIEAHDLEDQALTLAVDNDFYQTWLEENYLPLIRDALTAVDGDSYTISFVVQPRASKQDPEASAPRRRTIRERLRKPHIEGALNSKFTFDRFIVGSSNNFAHAASLAVAQAPARAYNPLFIYGDVGLGKTHLMQAIGHHVLGSARASVCYMSSETMLNEYISALQNRSLVSFRKKYRNTDLLLIDDIHFLAGKERIQEEFFHTFNALFDSHKQIVMTSDRPASEIAGLEQRLVSRFEWGLVTELEPPDFETRVAILRNKQEQADADVDDEIIQFIAEHVRSNIRRLEGALVRALSYASLTGRDLTIDTLRYLLRDALDTEETEDLSLEGIQKVVAEHYDIRLADMTSTRRPRSIAVPRQVAMYLCRTLTPASLPDIANAFSKTHATVLHAYRSVDSRMEVDTDLRGSVSTLARRLGRSLPAHVDG